MQRFDGIHSRGFIRRVEAEKDSYDQREQERDGHGLRRDNCGPADKAGQEPRAGDPKYHPGYSADRREDDRLDEEL